MLQWLLCSGRDPYFEESLQGTRLQCEQPHHFLMKVMRSSFSPPICFWEALKKKTSTSLISFIEWFDCIIMRIVGFQRLIFLLPQKSNFSQHIFGSKQFLRITKIMNFMYIICKSISFKRRTKQLLSPRQPGESRHWGKKQLCWTCRNSLILCANMVELFNLSVPGFPAWEKAAAD